MASVKDNSSEEYRIWVQAFILIDYGSRQRWCDGLFKKQTWSTDGVELYRKFELGKSIICQCNNNHQIFCPSIGFTGHCDFDLTLLTRVIKVIFGIISQSLVKDLINWRNQECHGGSKEVPGTDFDTIWKCTADILQNHHFDLAAVEDLKVGDIFSGQ